MFSKYLVSLFMLFFSLQLPAKTYNEWHLLYPNTFGTIRQVADADKKYTVTEFKSQSSRDTYINGAKEGKRAWHNHTSKVIQWDFKYQESYVIIISVETLDGDRNLIYTSGSDGGDLYFGLGSQTIDGKWHTIRRDLEADLERYEPNNSIVSVNAFIVRGSGLMDKIIMIDTPKASKILNKKKPISQERNRAVFPPKNSTNRGDSMPIVSLNQGELLYHKLGEPFFDPGATAKDSEGHPLTVDILGEVNINRVNRYVLTYVATDKQGNSTIETRVVMVYKAGTEERKPQPKSVMTVVSKKRKPSLLKEDGVGGAEDYPLTMEEIEALDEDMD